MDPGLSVLCQSFDGVTAERSAEQDQFSLS